MNKNSAYNLLRSFKCAFTGIARSLRYERNLRIHFLTSAYVIYFTRYFDLSKAELALVILMIGLVIACELINTAIEATVDLKTPAYSALAKTAKDAAAGAVLVSAAASVAVGAALFWRPPVFALIWADIMSAPVIWILLAAITVFLIAWPEYKQVLNGNAKAANFDIKADNENSGKD